MGYRDTSNYEPYGQQYGRRPIRPFNWVQWAGVGLVMFGIALDLYYFAGRLGLAQPMKSPTFAMGPMIVGIVLVNSRLEPAPDPAPELAPARKRWLVIIVTLSVAAILAATVAELLGA